jgi:rRNA maturation RNase YbeY
MVEVNNQTRSRIDLIALTRVAEQALKLLGLEDKELSVALVGDKRMTQLNRDYRGKDKPTDVLSFEGEDEDLGEVILDWQYIRRQARSLGRADTEELYFILIHGILHLAGHEDDTDSKRLAMIAEGEALLRKIKI